MRHRPVPPDMGQIREAFRGPDMDTREWGSMGLVGFDDGDPIVFDVDQGCPMVKVTLHPSFRKVYCRVAAPATGAAGNGEGEWSTFVENDEVAVVFPSGDPRDGAFISHRFNNAIDKFPMDSVAGQDPTTNSFSFKRLRSPRIEEYAGPWLVRNALFGNFIQLGADGSVTIKDGENAALQLAADVMGFAGPQSETSPPEFVMQFNLTARNFALQVGDAVLTLSASDANPENNQLLVPGSMTIGTLGNPPLEHAISTEAVANLIYWGIQGLFVTINALPPLTPVTNGTLAGFLQAWLNTTFPAAITAAGSSPLQPALLAAILGAFSAATQKPNTIAGQSFPGIGSPGLFLG